MGCKDQTDCPFPYKCVIGGRCEIATNGPCQGDAQCETGYCSPDTSTCTARPAACVPPACNGKLMFNPRVFTTFQANPAPH